MKAASLELSAASYPRRAPLTTGCCFWCTNNRVLRKLSKKCPPTVLDTTWQALFNSNYMALHIVIGFGLKQLKMIDGHLSSIYLLLFIYWIKTVTYFFEGEYEVKSDFDELCYSFRPTFPSRKGHSLIGCHSNQWWLSKVVNQTRDITWSLVWISTAINESNEIFKR